MIDDNSDGDEGGDDRSGHGAPPTFRPRSGPRRHPQAGHQDALPADEQIEHPAEPKDDFHRPRLLTLENGYVIVWDGELWLLFDDNEEFVGFYRNAEDAMKEAYLRKPLQQHGM